MVERELLSRRENIAKAVERINSAKGNLLGIVFVGSPSEKQYGYGYESYYNAAKRRNS